MPQRRTYYGNRTISTAVAQIFLRDLRRTGFVIVNRSATTLYLGPAHNIAVASSTTVRLLQNEILTILKSEGDDPTTELYGIASAASTVEVIESVEELA